MTSPEELEAAIAQALAEKYHAGWVALELTPAADQSTFTAFTDIDGERSLRPLTFGEVARVAVDVVRGDKP